MQNIKDILWNKLPRERVNNMNHHFKLMLQQLEYLKKNNNKNLNIVISHGWNLNVLKAICAISIFNHYIIGPMNKASKESIGQSISDVKSLTFGNICKWA